MPKRLQIPIIDEDDSVLVVCKPAGLRTVPDRWDANKPNLDEELKKIVPTASVVHRLDVGTSGVMVFAKTPEAHRSLSLQFQQRTVRKTYWALVRGIPVESSGNIDLPIAEDPKRPGKMIIHSRGKSSLSYYEVIARTRHFAVVQVYPQTGRHHQVRVHLAALGHPITADALYGGGDAFYLSEIKPNYRGKAAERPLLARVALHALRLQFVHPRTGQMVLYEANLPKDLTVAWKQIQRWD
ncbi:MAG: RluA family pseudouridine synthase [Gemmatimonadetes bacterium]|nr:MAG: RluA family pseudouridine synthase [Gemmatimonadota bacterium]